MKNERILKPRNRLVEIIYLLGTAISIALVLFAISRPMLVKTQEVKVQGNPDITTMQRELTKILLDERENIKSFPPSEARDRYLSRTDKVAGNQMVSLDEYIEIHELSQAATSHRIKEALREGSDGANL